MRIEGAKVSDPNTFVSCPGNQFKTIYSPIVNPDGTVDLKESGKEDIQEYIDSFRESTDISWIISRIQAGDDSVLNQKVPMYGDFTSMPSTYAEALQLVMDREAQFMQLPVEVRDQFNNDFRQWFATSGSEDWLSKMSSVLPHEEDPLHDSVKDGDSE